MKSTPLLRPLKLCAILSMIFVTSSAVANGYVTQPYSDMCDSTYAINPDSFDRKSKDENQFIFSDRYCITEMAARRAVDISTLPTLKTVRGIAKRYNKVYSTLENTDEKITFVDLFLHRASQQHHISLDHIRSSEESIQLIISSASVSQKSVSGYNLSLFQDDNIDSEISNTYSKHLSNISDVTSSSDVIDMVNYVLEGSSKKSLKVQTHQ
ncbi:hypothetical protein [Shewanella woodyi]|uniref:hypothetical protein n=1 Tax=Shewanella woodyi TaxID=60961 RepID=UPI0007F8BD8E|nr:hypothetical protein [Shewanella woodyi]